MVAEAAVDVVPLEHANAVELASTLRELLDASQRAIRWRGCALPLPGQENAVDRGSWGPTCPELQVVAIPRTNSLLLTVESETDRMRMRELIARLDEDAGRPR